jgi:glucokinase
MRICTADIGGTNSRFALFESQVSDNLVLLEEAGFKTDEVDSFEELIGTLDDRGFGEFMKTSDVVVIAVPGPVENGCRAGLANVEWDVDIEFMRRQLKTPKVFLINDFTAQAFACLTETAAKCRVVQQGRFDRGKTFAVIGAGTGLGHCALRTSASKGFAPFSSEAAHAAFPFVNDEETQYQKFLLKQTGAPYVIGDSVVCGSGLSMLHRFLTKEDLSPEEVARRIDVNCETARWFARFYARSCRAYALSALPFGGLFITGAIAVYNPFLVDNDAFRAEFLNSYTKRELLRKIPVFLNTDERSGLRGAALYGALQTRGLIWNDEPSFSPAENH